MGKGLIDSIAKLKQKMVRIATAIGMDSSRLADYEQLTRLYSTYGMA